MPKPLKPRPATSWSYVLRCDRELPSHEQTRFTLKPMSGADRDAYRDSLVRFQENMETTTLGANMLARRLCLSHIANVENFPPGATQPWPSDHDGRAAYLEQLDDTHVRELGNEIWTASALTSEERERAGEHSPRSDTSSSAGT